MQGKRLDFRNVKALFSNNEYLRSDVYGAILGWTGGAATLVALAFLVIQKLSLC